ncbi:PHP domain-containing protein [Herbiconiux sp. CPCC 203407]|uniref:PHP domain-containing protein n=1 Tax=Herbiconiux oxytropis TaxID=2970915 RepID=A0AA41XBZ3_9MICO|nr:PHP domain-containing protein [Herbiconiux oxytropis]MCS5722685.1 PHP domain-containing protein [Herbiconiux oxytropis]MCS5725382.1 PHP domain-containing protein [Herbiconiux oxytropis]
MTPQQALAEIAFRLERELAPSFKVKAFRRAAGVIDGQGAHELEARIADGRLKRTKGIGDSTYLVIRQAADGAVPDYLQKIRDRAEPGSGPGDDLHGLAAALRGDLHTHTEWSDGTTPLSVMLEAARSLGRDYLAVTDHSPDLKIANGLTAERLAEQLDEIDALRRGQAEEPGAPHLLAGIEVDILEDGSLDQEPALLDRLDVVVASVHSKLRADRATMTKRMLSAIENPRTNILGHCTGRLVQGSRGTRPPSEFDAEAVFAACAEHGVAVEINSRPERQDPPDDLLALARDAGCLFSIDSDAHAPGHQGFLPLGAARAEAAGIPAERILTTWPLPRLQEWLSDV